jgi:hypothetical protein
MKHSNKLHTGKNGNVTSSHAGFTPSVYSLKSNPVNVGRNSSQVLDASLGTKMGGNKLGHNQGK